MKRLVMDLDNTLTVDSEKPYEEAVPNFAVIEQLRDYKKLGFEIVIYTARNMRTFESNTGKINAVTLPLIIGWLTRHEIPYDEIFVGKPWCGTEGFYVDDKAIRPSEFTSLSREEIIEVLEKEKR
jgi:capsule biosynthesis phosphatase